MAISVISASAAQPSCLELCQATPLPCQAPSQAPPPTPQLSFSSPSKSHGTLLPFWLYQRTVLCIFTK